MSQALDTQPSYLTDARGFHPPCTKACPIHQDARGYLAHIAQGRYDEAVALIKETNPLAHVLGTICAHPCEAQCRRGKCDEPLSIRALKRFALEHGKSTPPAKKSQPSKDKVAVVGGGPAGLTAAHDLASAGYRVTIFDQESELGGVPNSYIPLYRLPRRAMKSDVDAILALGVEGKPGKALGKDFSIQDLKQEGYKAVLLALGLPVSRGLKVPGIEARDILLALPFLKAANSGQQDLCKGRNVIVIGGGNVAVDVARTALRSGAKHVQMVCLESDKEMPAYRWEIEEARDEGIDILCSTGPKRIMEKNGQLQGLEGVCCVSVFDAQGKFNPCFREEQTCVIEGDQIILAIGQGADLSWAKDNGVALNARGQLAFDTRTMATNQDGVFACGEVAIGPTTAVQAMASGRQAARSIVQYLEGKPFTPAAAEAEALGDVRAEVLNEVKRVQRVEVPALTVTQRAGNFNPMELGYGVEHGVGESRRCLNCGAGAYIIDDKCCACLTCVRICPYNVPVMSVLGDVVIRADQCQACGLCVNECPARAIAFTMPGVEDITERVANALRRVSVKSKGPAIVGFVCNYNLSGLTNSAPDNLALVAVPCLAKIGTLHLLKALELGADGVLLLGCGDQACQYKNAMDWTKLRLEAARKILADVGLEPARLAMFEVNRPSGEQLAGLIKEFALGAKS